MTTIYTPVLCAEVHGSRNEGVDMTGGWNASVQLQCTTADRFALMADLVGNRRSWPYGGLTLPPQCSSATCIPMPASYTQDGQACAYNIALVTASYSNTITDLASETIEPSAEFRTLDYRRFRWGSATGDPLLESEAPGQLIVGFTLVRTLYQVSSVSAAFLAYNGYSNSIAVYSSLTGLTFPADTILFQAGAVTRTYTTVGASAFTVNMKFIFNQNGWNKYFRASTQSWENQYVYNGSLFYSYPQVDLTPLF